ncbi:hypothetical protein EBT31_03950 [bacterium]|nr:hypothetical protein [bacterium]
MVVVSYGGGINSQALVIEAYRRGLQIDCILFANTGSEMPWTLRQNEAMNGWLAAHGMPLIEEVRWVREDGSFTPLHEWCIANNTLPSKAFGYAGCTSKWKQLPLDQEVRRRFGTQEILIERWIGYDADEPRRVQNLAGKDRQPFGPGGPEFMWRAPLAEWRMDRDACTALVRSTSLPFPMKSSCFMCPLMKPHEVVLLADHHPELLDLALFLEANATSVTEEKIQKRLLGMNMPRGMSWTRFMHELSVDGELRARVQRALSTMQDDEADEDMPCGCHE